MSNYTYSKEPPPATQDTMDYGSLPLWAVILLTVVVAGGLGTVFALWLWAILKEAA